MRSHRTQKAKIIKGPTSGPFIILAPRDGLEPPTKWLIPPTAGLYQLSLF